MHPWGHSGTHSGLFASTAVILTLQPPQPSRLPGTSARSPSSVKGDLLGGRGCGVRRKGPSVQRIAIAVPRQWAPGRRARIRPRHRNSIRAVALCSPRAPPRVRAFISRPSECGRAPGPGTILSDLHHYDPAARRWTDLSGARGRPSPRGYYGLALAPGGDLYLLSGDGASGRRGCAVLTHRDPRARRGVSILVAVAPCASSCNQEWQRPSLLRRDGARRRSCVDLHWAAGGSALPSPPPSAPPPSRDAPALRPKKRIGK
jgi:hypothetical protein